MRKTLLVIGEYYHVFNRGVDKRNIFSDQYDLQRFFQSMFEFNSTESIGSIYENSFRHNELGNSIPKLVDCVAYCLNPNHYHFILKPLVENGIQKFMHKLGLGYTNYFNEKHDRTGALFQGKYKAVHVNSNTQLLHLSAYVNLNNRIDESTEEVFNLSQSSFPEYITKTSQKDFCKKEIVLGQFASKAAYEKFARSSLSDILRRKKENKEMSNLGIEFPSEM